MAEGRVLITGISGFFGPHLAKKLIEEGYEVVGITRPKADYSIPRRIVEENIQSLIKLEHADVTKFHSIARIIIKYKPDAIIHLAAQSHVGVSFNEPELTLKTNTEGTLNVLEAIKNYFPDTTVILAGTSEEYGLVIASESHLRRIKQKYGDIIPEPQRIPELPINENNPLRPRSPYAISKVAAEFFVRNYAESYEIDGRVVRGFNFEGAGRGPNFVTSSVAIQVLDVVNNRKSYVRLGNVNAFRDWTHVYDMSEAYYIFLEKGKPGDVINVGSMRTNSVLTLLLLAFKQVGWEVERVETKKGNLQIDNPLDTGTRKLFGVKYWHSILDEMILEGLEFTPEKTGDLILYFENKRKVRVHLAKELYRPADVPILMADITKANRKYGIRPKHTLDDIIKDLVIYYSDPIVRRSILI